MQEFKTLSDWDFMVDFPTQGNVCLDNCLTNGANQYFILFSGFHLEKKKKTLNEGLTNGLEVPARPGPV